MERVSMAYYADQFKTSIHTFKLPMFTNEAIRAGKDVDNIVHARNIVFAAHAAHVAAYCDYTHICVGVNKTNSRTASGDNSQHFLNDMDALIHRYTKGRVSVISYSKDFAVEDMHKELIKRNMDISHLWMCERDGQHSNGKFKQCGKCHKCKKFLAPPRDESKETKQFIEKVF